MSGVIAAQSVTWIGHVKDVDDDAAAEDVMDEVIVDEEMADNDDAADEDIVGEVVMDEDMEVEAERFDDSVRAL